MFVFHALSEVTRRHLLDAGLDPDALSGLIRHAIAEDLMGGIDVTSTATIPADQRSIATFGAREAGVVAGLPVVASVRPFQVEGLLISLLQASRCLVSIRSVRAAASSFR